MKEIRLAGVLGFEPRMAVPKTAALPLGYTPTVNLNTIQEIRIRFQKKVVSCLKIGINSKKWVLLSLKFILRLAISINPLYKKAVCNFSKI